MSEKPIIFSAPMVRALLAGTKTQTRRVVKPAPQMVTDRTIAPWDGDPAVLMRLLERSGKRCRYGQPGDRLWVRESLHFDSECGHFYAATMPGSLGNPSGSEYLAMAKEPEGKEIPDRSIPSIHMPRWASRITLEITGVRVERLQDISEADAHAEGCSHSFHLQGGRSATENFKHLWETINGDESWEANPWVWVIEFKRVKT